MKVISSLFLCIYFFAFDKYTPHYEVECGEKAQWLNGKKSCSIYDGTIFISANNESNHKQFTVFKLKIQNIGNDTVAINPKNCYISRVYTNGSTDSVSICNPELYIEKANADIAHAEKEINNLVKGRNTENAVINIARSTPWGSKANTGSQSGSAVYNEKLKSEQNNLLDAKAEKAFWETQALRANTIYPMSYIEGDIFFETNNCMKLILHVNVHHKQYDFLINQVTE